MLSLRGQSERILGNHAMRLQVASFNTTGILLTDLTKLDYYKIDLCFKTEKLGYWCCYFYFYVKEDYYFYLNPFEFSLNVFNAFAEFTEKIFVLTVKALEPATQPPHV